MQKIEDNSAFVTRLMDFARCGPIMQAFIIDAIGNRSKVIIKHQERVREEMKNGVIHPEAWIAAAKEIQDELAKRSSFAKPDEEDEDEQA
jgi:hypothetical protein